MFRDRHEAGRTLARELEHLTNREDVVVDALPRGGVGLLAETAS